VSHSLSISAEGFGGRLEMGEGSDVGQAQRNKMRDSERARFGDVAERGAADVAVVGGVGQGADADAVQDNPNDTAEQRHGRENVAQWVRVGQANQVRLIGSDQLGNQSV